MIVNSLTNIGVAVIISFYFSWKLRLVLLCVLPFLAVSGGFQAKMITVFAKQDNQAMEDAGRVGYSTPPHSTDSLARAVCNRVESHSATVTGSELSLTSHISYQHVINMFLESFC